MAYLHNRAKFNQINLRKLKEWEFFYKDKIEEFKPFNFGQSIIFLDLETGFYYYGLEDLSSAFNIERSNMYKKLKKEYKNRIKYRQLFLLCLLYYIIFRLSKENLPVTIFSSSDYYPD